MVLSHAQALLRSEPTGACAYLDADLREPASILAEAAKTLDFSRPMAVMLIAVLHCIPDQDGPHRIAAELMDGGSGTGSDRLRRWLSPGSGWRRVGLDALQGAPAHPAHDRVVPGVVPDCSHRLHEGPCLAALPLQIVALKVVAEHLSGTALEQMPDSHEIQRRVSGAHIRAAARPPGASCRHHC
jgi:hypothetical protein